MGSCISKCRPRPSSNKHKEDHSLLVQDKLVIISQSPTIPDINPLIPNKQQPNSSLISSPSPSSDSCTSNITTTSTCSTSTLSSSSSTCSSSALVSKDRSFSNDFLWARLKENPHIIPHGLLDPLKETPVKVVAPKFPTRKLDSSSSKSAVQGRIGLPPQKRSRERSSSPTLAPERSFRKEFERPQPTSSLPRRNFGSPSPSRRFNGDPCRGIPINAPKRCNSPNRGNSPKRKENLQLRSPLNKVSRDGSSQLMRKRETCTHHIQDGIGIDDQNSVGAMVLNKDSNSLPMDDLNNPLISLDCFIFL
ncbi:probable serine/threonine-protein kinase dyrk2 [Macadamia integrifolia]|uniref:probable serine/threonine-protein kinase dyrk2 n=1 Tax=Macadamia integrifolia TaxID=60698 RepID=UPI001C4EDF9B|nr:probable serine/threonine-protein kinase dyrk2 [Macadamia integrifolia]